MAFDGWDKANMIVMLGICLCSIISLDKAKLMMFIVFSYFIGMSCLWLCASLGCLFIAYAILREKEKTDKRG